MFFDLLLCLALQGHLRLRCIHASDHSRTKTVIWFSWVSCKRAECRLNQVLVFKKGKRGKRERKDKGQDVSMWPSFSPRKVGSFQSVSGINLLD